MGDRASQHHGVQCVYSRHVVDKLAAPAQKAQVLQAFDRAADRPVRWGVRCHRYSIFTPAAFTTSPHFTRWARVKVTKASGLSESTESAPAFMSCSLTSGSPQMRLASAAILSTIGRGVPAGANNPCQAVASKPLMVSPIAGTSGAEALRCGVLTPSARTVPCLACGQTVVMLSMAMSTLPPSMLFTTSPVDLYGTCVILAPIACSNITTERCDDVPRPDEA